MANDISNNNLLNQSKSSYNDSGMKSGSGFRKIK